jgi:flagellar hook assembly protein FlgD
VAIKVLWPAGMVVKTVSVASGVAAYSVTWNGRSSSGAMLSNGTYKVVQVLTDAAGTKQTVTTSVVIASKRLYYGTR